jgi:uncharacterized membrane protein
MNKYRLFLEGIVIIAICVIVTDVVLPYLSIEKDSFAEFFAYMGIWLLTFFVCSLVSGFGKRMLNRIVELLQKS